MRLVGDETLISEKIHGELRIYFLDVQITRPPSAHAVYFVAYWCVVGQSIECTVVAFCVVTVLQALRLRTLEPIQCDNLKAARKDR